ncbi:Clustered mitochondria protein [Glycine soja]
MLDLDSKNLLWKLENFNWLRYLPYLALTTYNGKGLNTIHILGEVSYNVIGIYGIFYVKLRFYLFGELVLKVNGNLNNFVVGYLLEVAQELRLRKKTYYILVKQLGEDDSRTPDSQNWMNTFKMRELQGQALNAASAQKAIDILKCTSRKMETYQVKTFKFRETLEFTKRNPEPNPVF